MKYWGERKENLKRSSLNISELLSYQKIIIIIIFCRAVAMVVSSRGGEYCNIFNAFACLLNHHLPTASIALF